LSEALVHVEHAFVFGQVAAFVCLRQNAPRLGWKAQRVRQGLEDHVTVLGPITMVAERRASERMGSIVGQIEPAFDGDSGVGGVAEACRTGPDQAVELPLGTHFPFEVGETNKMLARIAPKFPLLRDLAS
jgi:hypothetical protein